MNPGFTASMAVDIGGYVEDNVVMGANGSSRVVLIAIGVGVAVLVGVAIAIAMQPPPMFDPTTPEGTAQGYFQALHEGDDALVASYLTDDLKDRCDTFPDSEDSRHYEQRDATSVSIISTEIDGHEARVEVAITITYDEGPFAAGSDTFNDTLVMQHQGDRWLISEPSWPWDRHSCEKVDR